MVNYIQNMKIFKLIIRCYGVFLCFIVISSFKSTFIIQSTTYIMSDYIQFKCKISNTLHVIIYKFNV